MKNYIYWDCDKSALAQLGSKAAFLAELNKIEVNIPPGFYLSGEAFLDFLHENNIFDTIKTLLSDIPDNLHAIQKIHQQIADLFVNALIPGAIISSVVASCKKLSSMVPLSTDYAVRSSSIIEDLNQSSFAGLYDSCLGIQSCDSVLQSILKCWLSAFNVRSLSHIRKIGLTISDPGDIAMGVIIQKMIKAEFAGVMLTVNPMNGDPSKIVIEYTEGICDLLVSGECVPKSLVMDKISLLIDDYDKSTETTVMDEIYLKELASLAAKIEKHFGCYQDIEWAIDKDNEYPGNVFILQARPETIWNEKNSKSCRVESGTILDFLPEIKILKE